MPRPLAALFALIALPTCLLLAVLVPPGQVADEPAHIARADALRHGAFHGTRREVVDASGATVRQTGVKVDANLFAVAFVLRPASGEKLDLPRYAAHRALDWSGDRLFAEIGTVATYLPLFYVPAAIGLGGAKSFGAGPYVAVITGRIVAALCFVALGFAALTLAQRGRALMLCVLCCPMTLSLAASFNQDGLLIAASALAAALATRNERRSRWAAAALIAGVAAVKLPYLPLAALLLLHSDEPFARRARLLAITALPAFLWTGLMLGTVSAPVARPPYAPGPLWPGDPTTIFTGTDPAAQLSVLMADPLRLLWLPARTILHDPWLIPQGIGVLGWLDVVLPTALYAGWAVAIAFTFLADLLAARDQAVRGRDAAVLLGATLAAVWAIYLSQYLLWTDVGNARIDGPTGRYFLPLIPMLAVALPSLKLPEWRTLSIAATAAPVLAGLAGLIVLPAIVVGAYYLR